MGMMPCPGEKPILKIEPFIPRRGLASGHLQTLAGYFLRRPNTLPAGEPRIVEVEPGVRILCRCHWQPQSQQRLTVIVLHGLAGSCDSPQVVGLASRAWAAGMNVVRMNMRNCGGTETLTPALFHSGLSGDVAAVVRELISTDGVPRIALAAYSMGANMILKLLGEWGENNSGPREVCAAAVVSPLMDLAASSSALHTGWNRIYERHFVRQLGRLYRRKAELFPDIYDVHILRGIRSMYDFDDRIVGPCGGFRSADDYYERARSSRLAGCIQVPTLILHSKDDPFIRILPETRARLETNPRVEFVETERGGHCGFLAASQPNDDGRWAERAAIDYLSNF